MIISASYKTDIPAFYSRWFLNRLEAGHCLMVNPYGRQTHRIYLSPAAVDGFVFWTRNAAPFGDALEAVAARGTPFMIQMTVTGYPRVLESNVPETARAVDQIRALARRWGPRAVVWRYDPVVLSSLTDERWHRTNFTGIAEALKGSTDEVVLSFLQPYRKTARNFNPMMASASRFTVAQVVVAQRVAAGLLAEEPLQRLARRAAHTQRRFID